MFLRHTSGLLGLLLGLHMITPTVSGAVARPKADAVDWKSCGEGFQCANVSVPMDHHNASDTRTMSIAVTRFLATDKQNRKGSVFINPGGPGDTGTGYAFNSGPALSVILQGQYDIIGFDPRGVNLTLPYVSCFDSQLDQDAFLVYTNNFQLNLPGNISAFTPSVESNLQSQVSQFNSDFFALAAHCYKKTGDAVAYMGTEAVVRDIDVLSKKIDGDDARINYWGISYGTIIGQYMVKILHPDRLGRIIIDGVANPDAWNQYAIDNFDRSPVGMTDSFRAFASTCVSAGVNCTLNALNFSSADALISAVDNMVDVLYQNPAPVYDLAHPAIATAADLRFALGLCMYSIERWPLLADGLALAFAGNFTPLISLAKPWVSKTDADVPDNSLYVQQIIFCDDAKPYDDSRAPPTTAEITQLALQKVSESPNWGSTWFFHLLFCHAWEKAGLSPRRSRYDGTFELANGTLTTPMLILSNTVDPATPLINAQAALNRLGDNARLIQQVDGYGHCSISVVSFCTLLAVRKYMVNGTLPGDSYTLCDVDQHPWLPSEAQPILSKRQVGVDEATKAAWRELSRTLPSGPSL